MLEKTKNSIENMYDVFKKYRLDNNMEASPLYSKEKVKQWNESISTKPMRALSGDELAFFAFKVGYTWGTEQDYKHFLPRFFEVIAQYKEGLIETFVVFQKLEYFKWKSWSKDEYQSILAFMNAFWIQLLTDKKRPWQFETLFSSMVKVHPSVDWMLNQWLASESESAIYQFCNFIDYNSSGIERRVEIESFNEYPKDYTDLSAVFIQWSVNKMKTKLENVYDKITDQELQDQLLDTLDVLEKITPTNNG